MPSTGSSQFFGFFFFFSSFQGHYAGSVFILKDMNPGSGLQLLLSRVPF